MTISLPVGVPAAAPQAGAARPGGPPRWLGGAVPLLPVVGAALISQTWFRAGTFLARGDITPFVRDGVAEELGWLWNHQVVGSGSANSLMSRAPEVAVSRAVGLLGGSDLLAQRVFYALVMGLLAAGAYSVCSAVSRSRWAVMAGTVVAVVNPFVLSQVPSPIIPVAIGTLGLLGGWAVRAARGRPPGTLALVLATVPGAYLAENPPLLVVVVVGGIVVFAVAALSAPAGPRSVVGPALRALPFAVVANLWWVAPALLAVAYGIEGARFTAETDVSAWAWTHARSSLDNVLTLNTSWAWSFPDYVSYARRLDRPLWGALRFALPTLALAAPLVSRGRRRQAALVLVGGSFVLLLVAKGLHPPGAGVNRWLFEHVPGLWLLREPMPKVGVVLVLAFAVLTTITLDAVLGAAPGRAGRRWPALPVVLAGLAVAATVAASHPLYSGAAVPAAGPTLPSAHPALPPAWRQTASAVNGSGGSGKVLVLPLNDYYQMPTRWGYYGVDNVAQMLFRRPVVQRFPGGYFREEEAYGRLQDSVERSLTGDRTDAAVPFLRALGVSSVVVRHDLDLGFPGRRITDPGLLETGVRRLPGARLAHRSEVASVYDLEGAEVAEVLVVGRPGGADGPAGPVVTARGPGAFTRTGAPGAEVSRHNPARYEITVEGGPPVVLLTLAETYSPRWRLEGLPRTASVRHVRLHGYANGWLVDGASPRFRARITYGPAAPARAAVGASLVALGLVVTGLGARAWARRRPRPGPPVPAPVEGPA